MGIGKIATLEKEIMEKAQELHRLRREGPPEAVEDHVLLARDGREVTLGSLFGARRDLLVVHNMGRGCPYCTLWADSFNGVLGHIESRTAFAVVSPDAPDDQAAFADSRGWLFRMLSDRDRAFTRAMGFLHEDSPWPGFSTFRKTPEGGIERVASGFFGPGDLYLGLWHLFANLDGGVGDWQPRLSYGE